MDIWRAGLSALYWDFGRPNRPTRLSMWPPLDRFVGTYRIGSAVISVRQDGTRLTISGDGIEQLSERVFTYQGGGMFAAVENPELRLTFTPVQPRSPRAFH